MFESYTEKARRVIFFARYEASQFGSPTIETEHLLLGLLREDKALTHRILQGHATVEAIRGQIEARTIMREKIATTVDLPLSDEGKRVLAYAAEEADRFSHKHIGTEHLLLGLLREEKCFAAQLLKERGVELKTVREEIARKGVDPGKYSATVSRASAFRDLTQAAAEGELEPVIGRDTEVDAIVTIISSRYRRSAVLVGDRGVGKTAIVEALAQRIAGKNPPAFLGSKNILVLDSTAAGNLNPGARFDDLAGFVRVLGSASPDDIIFIDDLFAFVAAIGKSGLPIHSAMVRREFLNDQRQYLQPALPANRARRPLWPRGLEHASARFMSARSMRNPPSRCCVHAKAFSNNSIK